MPIVSRKKTAPEGKKWCPDCNAYIDIAQFRRSKGRYDSLSAFCKDHDLQRRRERYRNNPDKYLDIQYRRNYGISLAEYKTMVLQQGGVCAACHRPEPQMVYGKQRGLSLDHNHSTGERRALLCSECNAALGHLREDPERIRCLLEYIMRFQHEQQGNYTATDG